MHKILLILGLLHHGPLHGYELHRIIRAHGELYADLKKANLYYLLDRLAADGYLHVDVEPGARGARGERLVYTLTDAGRDRFDTLLREALRVPRVRKPTRPTAASRERRLEGKRRRSQVKRLRRGDPD